MILEVSLEGVQRLYDEEMKLKSRCFNDEQGIVKSV